MVRKLIRIATRKSALALWQANYIKSRLEKANPTLKIELLELITTGDKIITESLSKIGGKGLFVKELENALLAGEADIAVHSMKDVPMDLPDDLILAIMCERENPCDAFISNKYTQVAALPAHSIIGTSSLRRSCQLLALRPDLIIQPLRGNVDTRVRRLDEGKFDAIILAAAGLLRLDLHARIREYLTPENCLPAAGQGALGIECRRDDSEIIELIQPLNHADTYDCVRAERAMTRQLGGSCQIPIAAYATLDNGHITLRGLLGPPDGSLILRAIGQGSRQEAEIIGKQVADSLERQGAKIILQELVRH